MLLTDEYIEGLRQECNGASYLTFARAVIAACEAKLREPVALSFAILDEELQDLHRFHECVSDGEGYDVPKERMKRLAEVGLLRRVTANIYEHTTFGLSVINGDFIHPAQIPECIQDFIHKFKRHVGGDGEFWLHELEDFYDKMAAARSGE